MFTITSYLAKNTYRSFLMVLLSLLSLFTIFSLVENIEIMDSSIVSIFYFQLLSVPGRLYDLMPISILIGTTLSINWLSKNNEWLTFNIIGISNIKLIFTLWLINIPILIFSLFLSEYLIPTAEIKNLNNNSIREKQSNKQLGFQYWINDFKNTRNIIIHIANIMRDGKIERITLYEFGKDKKLAKICFADHGQFVKKCMILKNVTIKTINSSIFENRAVGSQEKYINTSFFESISYDTNIDKNFLFMSKLAIDRIPIFELYKYKKSNMISNLQEIELYNKATYLLLLFLMIPIAANSIETNQSKNQTRIIVTLLIGVILFIIIKLLPIIGSFYDYPAIATTLIPSISILTLSIYNVIKRENL